ncbi:MAG: Hpt domain-containing protein [Xanthomonadaceae bacterium]|nr:Hpt domain-containing protein [Xanthomonadaceae bacterium]
MSQKIVVKVDAEIKELIPGYLENRKKEIAELESYFSKKDFDAIAKIGHKLKGNAAGYGFIELGEIAIRLESASKKSDLNVVKNCIDSIKSYLSSIEIEYVEVAA